MAGGRRDDRRDGGRGDRRVERTHAAIRSAFEQMVLEMDANEITVSELAERAGIHRKTFYLHYSCIEDLVAELVDDLFERYVAMIDEIGEEMTIEETNRVFYDYLESQGQLIDRLIMVPSYQGIVGRLWEQTREHNRGRHNPYAALPRAEQDVVNAFLTQTSTNLYVQWVRSGRALPRERMVELTSELLARGAGHLRDDA